MSRCACGLNGKCPDGYTTLDCPTWQKRVRPNIFERIIGAIAALFMGRP